MCVKAGLSCRVPDLLLVFRPDEEISKGSVQKVTRPPEPISRSPLQEPLSLRPSVSSRAECSSGLMMAEGRVRQKPLSSSANESSRPSAEPSLASKSSKYWEAVAE